MHIQISGQQIDIGDALRTHVTEKLQSGIAKYFDQPIDGTVTFTREGEGFAYTTSTGPLDQVEFHDATVRPDGTVLVCGKWSWNGGVLCRLLPDGLPDMANVRAFLAGPNDAICIHQDVWHAGLTVLDGPAEFAMMMWRATAGDDGIVHTLDTPLKFSID